MTAIEDLFDLCRRGEFYQDYDLSWEVLAEAEREYADLVSEEQHHHYMIMAEHNRQMARRENP